MKNKRHIVWLGVLIAALLAFPSVVVNAQDDQPTVVGNTDADSLQVVRRFLEEGDDSTLAENVTMFDRTLPAPVEGREAVVSARNEFFTDTFSEVFYRPIRYIVSDEFVTVQFEFRGENLASDVAANAEAPDDETTAGNDVTVPMVGIFQVQDGQIVNVEMYYDAASLQYQLGYDPYSAPYYTPYYGVPGAPTAGAAGIPVDLDVDDIVENTDQYYGVDVVVQGVVGAAITDNAFLIHDEDLIDFDQEQMLVIDAAEDGLDFVQLADANVLVAGTVQQFALADIESEFGVDLDDAAFADYEGTPVLMATSALNLYDVATVENVVADPAAFYDQTISLQGDVSEMVGEKGFILGDDDLIDLDPETVLIIAPGVVDGTLTIPTLDEDVVVTGTVQEFVLTDIESAYDIDLDDNAFADHETLPVLVADTIFSWE